MAIEVMSLKGSVDIDLSQFERKKKQLVSEWQQLGKTMGAADPTARRSGSQALSNAQRQEARFANELAAAEAKLTSALAGESSAAQQVAARYSSLSAVRRQDLVNIMEQQQALQKAARSQEQLGNNLKTLGGSMTLAITAPLVAFGVHAAKVFGTTEQNLNVFQQQTGATADEMKRAGDLARQLGADMSLPATSSADAAQSMVELGKGGLSVKEAMEGARPALQLTAAAGGDVADNSRFAATAIKSFHLEGMQLTRVIDQLAGAANASTADIGDMKLGFQQAGAVFAQAGRSTLELNTALGLMSNAGIRGSDAGTSLKVMLLGLNNDTDKVKSALKALGVEAFDPVTKRMKPMREQVAQFSEGLAKLNQKSQMSALKDIFGADAFRAAQVILGGGIKQWDEMSRAVDKQGTAAAAAAAKNKGLLGAIDAMKSAFDTAASSAIEPVSKDLANMARRTGELLGKFAELPAPVRRFGVELAGVAVVTGPLVYGLGQFITAAKVIKDTIPTVVSKLGAMKAAVQGANLATVAFGAALTLSLGSALAFFGAVAFNFDGWRDHFIAGLGFIGDSFANFWSNLQAVGGPAEFFASLKESFLRGLGELGNIMQAGWIRLRAILSGQPDPGAAAWAQATGQEMPSGPTAAPKPPKPRSPFTPATLPTGPGNYEYEGKGKKDKKTPLQSELEQLRGQLNATNTEATALLDGVNPRIAALMGQYRQAAATPKGALLIGQVGKAQGLADFRKEMLDLNLQIKENSRDDPQGLNRLRRAWTGIVPDEEIERMAEARQALKDLAKVAQGWEQMRSLRQDLSTFQGGTGGRVFKYDTATRQAMQMFGTSADRLTDKQREAGGEFVRNNRVVNRNKEIAAAREQEQQDIVSATARVGEALLKTTDDFRAFASGSKVAQRALEMLRIPLDLLPKAARIEVTKTIKEIMRLESIRAGIQQFAEGIKGIFQGAFTDLAENGFGKFFANVYGGFKRLLVQMAADFLSSQLRNLVVKGLGSLVGAAFGGGASVAAAGASAGGGGGGGGGGLGGAIGNFFGDMSVSTQSRGGPIYSPASGPVLPASVSRSGGARVAAAGAGGITINMHIRGEDTPAARQNAGMIASRTATELQRQKSRNGY